MEWLNLKVEISGTPEGIEERSIHFYFPIITVENATLYILYATYLYYASVGNRQYGKFNCTTIHRNRNKNLRVRYRTVTSMRGTIYFAHSDLKTRVWC